MRNRRKTLWRDHAVPEVKLRLAQGTIKSQPYLRPSPFKDLKDLPCASLIASLSLPYYASMFSLTPLVPGKVLVVGNNRSMGSHGLRHIIKKYGKYPIIWDLIEL